MLVWTAQGDSHGFVWYHYITGGHHVAMAESALKSEFDLSCNSHTLFNRKLIYFAQFGVQYINVKRNNHMFDVLFTVA